MYPLNKFEVCSLGWVTPGLGLDTLWSVENPWLDGTLVGRVYHLRPAAYGFDCGNGKAGSWGKDSCMGPVNHNIWGKGMGIWGLVWPVEIFHDLIHLPSYCLLLTIEYTLQLKICHHQRLTTICFWYFVPCVGARRKQTSYVRYPYMSQS